jgi:tRNA(fMet)-specific endonuclease VapC
VKYIFDTNVCIQILKGKSPKLKNKLQNISNSEVSIPSVVKFELFYGAYKSNNPDKSLSMIKGFASMFEIINFTSEIAEHCGQIRATLEKVGTPIGPYDLIIAATAISENLILVTNNTREFERVNNIQLEDWQ